MFTTFFHWLQFCMLCQHVYGFGTVLGILWAKSGPLIIPVQPMWGHLYIRSQMKSIYAMHAIQLGCSLFWKGGFYCFCTDAHACVHASKHLTLKPLRVGVSQLALKMSAPAKKRKVDCVIHQCVIHDFVLIVVRNTHSALPTPFFELLTGIIRQNLLGLCSGLHCVLLLQSVALYSFSPCGWWIRLVLCCHCQKRLFESQHRVSVLWEYFAAWTHLYGILFFFCQLSNLSRSCGSNVVFNFLAVTLPSTGQAPKQQLLKQEIYSHSHVGAEGNSFFQSLSVLLAWPFGVCPFPDAVWN